MAVVPNKYSFCQHVQLAPFCIITNLRENRFLQPAGQLVSLEGTHNVKKHTEKWTFLFELTSL